MPLDVNELVASAKIWWKHIVAAGSALLGGLTILAAATGNLKVVTGPISQMFSGPSSVPKIAIRDINVTGPITVNSGSSLMRVDFDFVVDKDGGPELKCDLKYETKGIVVSGDTQIILQKGARQEQINTSVTINWAFVAKESSFRLQCPNIITTRYGVTLPVTTL